MKKLTTLFAIALLSTTVALAGCKKKRSEEAKDNTAPAEKTTEAKPDDKTAPKPDDKTAVKPDDKTAPVAAAASDLPAECNDYKAAIDKLSTCDKMPQGARDALKTAFDQAAASWATLPAESKKGLGTACKAGADAVTQSAKTTCGW